MARWPLSDRAVRLLSAGSVYAVFFEHLDSDRIIDEGERVRFTLEVADP